MLIPAGARVTPLALKVHQEPQADWYEQARLVLRGRDGGEHGKLLYSLIRERQAYGRKVVALDIGTARGFSAITMSRALLDADLDGHVYTMDVIDHDDAYDWHAAKHSSDDPLADGPSPRSAIWKRWFPDETTRITSINGRSTRLLRDWPHGRIDVAFLDGSHAYDDVKAELDMLDAIMADDGVIVLDDVHFGVVIGRVRSRAVSVLAWLVLGTLRKVIPKAQFHNARLGVGAEYAIVERRFTGIRKAVEQFIAENGRDWSIELVPMPRRGAYQTGDYALAVLTRQRGDGMRT
ncbi:MAG: class I SAM-dependent methyltransferase [Gammaproteobacteria bacterium]|nr:class I SAM-dependent methyltransferase [Gammaproteobacteria bacterium]